MVARTSFSIVAKKLREQLAVDIPDLDESSITISHPKEAKPLSSHNSLNLFFYRIENEEFPVDGLSTNPVLLGLNCLITAYGIDEKDAETTAGSGGPPAASPRAAAAPAEEVEIKITSGENDLRIIGEVIRVLHEKPIIKITEDDQIMHLQSVRLPLSLDDINHIWSTQADTPYRLSIAYQFSLIPLPFKQAQKKGPLVTGVGANVYSDLHPPVLPATGFSVHVQRPEVEKVIVNVNSNDWVPHISFIENNKLSYVLEIDDKATDLVRYILVAGDSGTELELYWELWEWDLNNNKGGWKPPVIDIHADSIVIPEATKEDNGLLVNVIDPENINTRIKVKIQIPVVLPPAENVRLQASLYAIRKQTRYRPQSNPYTVNIRSNLLAVTVVHEGASV